MGASRSRGAVEHLALEADLAADVLAPIKDDLTRALRELIEVAARHRLVEADPGAFDGGVEATELEAAVAAEEHAPVLAVAGGVDADDVRVDREDGDEADPELADLGPISVLGGREEAGELLLDDLAVHAAAPVLDLELRDAARLRCLIGQADLDLFAAGVEAVLDQLAVEREGVAELVDQLVEGVGDAQRGGFSHQEDPTSAGGGGGATLLMR
jgi:hypothetical protein